MIERQVQYNSQSFVKEGIKTKKWTFFIIDKIEEMIKVKKDILKQLDSISYRSLGFCDIPDSELFYYYFSLTSAKDDIAELSKLYPDIFKRDNDLSEKSSFGLHKYLTP
jgi:hypothetical protein